MTIQTWTYSGDPSASSLDAVRFLIGDTDPTDRQLSDEEILYLTTQRTSDYGAASSACLALVAKYSRQVSTYVGDLRVAAEQRQEHYQQLHEHYNIQAGEAAPYTASAPYGGGISGADRNNQISDKDRVQPAFEMGSMDRRGSDRGQWRGGSTSWR